MSDIGFGKLLLQKLSQNVLFGLQTRVECLLLCLPKIDLTFAPTGVWATLVPTGGGYPPPEISKTKQARDKR